jgi:L,D-transpeptidase-like protein
VPELDGEEVQEASPSALKPGQYLWHPERAPACPVVVIVNLSDQLADVYRNGVRIGVTTVSTGKEGQRTPTGVFTILQTQCYHRSTLYDSAPMPYMERLTRDGVALHAGGLPGYPSSHGCVHLPRRFSQVLYGMTSVGSTVVIADAHGAPEDVLHPGLLLPPDADPAQPPGGTAGSAAEYVWQPERSPEGPVNVLISGADRMVYVYRNGVPIGRARVQILTPEKPLGIGVFTLLDGSAALPGAAGPGQPTPRWMAVDLQPTVQSADIARRVKLPPAFAQLIGRMLHAGTTLMVTDPPATEGTKTPHDFTVMASVPGPTR